MKFYKKYLLVALFTLMLGVTANQVSAQVTDDPILKACEETADQLKKARIEIEGLKAQLEIKNQTIELQNQKIFFVQEQANYYKKAFETSEKVDVNSNMIITNLRVEVGAFKDENNRLRIENEKLRGSRTLRTIIGFGAGLGTGIIINK